MRQQISSLREVVLAAHDRQLVEVCRRDEDGGWSTDSVGAGGAAQLTSIECTLDIDELYENPLRG